MKLEPLMDMEFSVDQPIQLGEGPLGARVIANVREGKFEGPELRGRILGGGDWMLMDKKGVGRIDVRMSLQTRDEASIYLSYVGLFVLNDDLHKLLERGSDFGDQYFVTQPRFETGDPRYLWINDIVCIAEGCFRAGGGGKYRIYKALPG